MDAGVSRSSDVGAALSRFARMRIPSGRDPLRPMRQVLSALGDPHLALPPCIHIAGTNGKGSIAAVARSVAEAAGLSVHVFTSPHLVRPTERIRLCGKLIADGELVGVLDQIVATAVEVTYFEAFAAAAFICFSRVDADLAIIETGAGGSFDATNVLPAADVAVISAIGRDHEAMFGVRGETAIARVKAGIMRPGRPVVIARQSSDEVHAVLLDCARHIGARPYVSGSGWRCGQTDDGMTFSEGDTAIGPVALALAGRHQADNAGAALAALLCTLDRESVLSGLSGLTTVCWPGRMQTLGTGPLTASIPGEVIADGAHNEDGVGALAAEIVRRGRRTAAVMAIGINKPAERMIAILAASVSGMVFCSLPDPVQEAAPEGLDPSGLAEIAGSLGVACAVTDGLPEAMAEAARLGEDVCICGSLYLIGEALRLNHQVPD